MFRHEDIAVYAEFVFLPGFFEDSEEDLFNSMVVKQRMPLVTTAGDEMRGVGNRNGVRGDSARIETKKIGFVRR